MAATTYTKKRRQGAGDDELLLKSDEDKWITDWSRDGRFLVYNTLTEKADIWALPLVGDRKPVPFFRTQFAEALSKVSPDGQWMAYVSNESGQSELYVRPFRQTLKEGSPASADRWQISAGDGGSAVWRRDGKELFYHTGGKIMAVEVKTRISKGRSVFEASVPKLLFDAKAFGYDYFVATADGQQLLVNIPIAEERPLSINVVLNWPALLK
jgi:hypothetical protein